MIEFIEKIFGDKTNKVDITKIQKNMNMKNNSDLLFLDCDKNTESNLIELIKQKDKEMESFKQSSDLQINFLKSEVSRLEILYKEVRNNPNRNQKAEEKEIKKFDHGAHKLKTRYLVKIFENMVLGADNSKLKNEIAVMNKRKELLRKQKNTNNLTLVKQLESIRAFEASKEEQ